MVESRTATEEQIPEVESLADPFTGVPGVGPITDKKSELPRQKGQWDLAFQWMGMALLAIAVAIGLYLLLS